MRNSFKAYTLIEAVVAILILGIAITTSMQTFSTIYHSSILAEDQLKKITTLNNFLASLQNSPELYNLLSVKEFTTNIENVKIKIIQNLVISSNPPVINIKAEASLGKPKEKPFAIITTLGLLGK